SALETGGFCLLQRSAPDKISFFHFAEAIEPGFPDIDLVRDLVPVQRHAPFQTKRVARTQTAGHNSEFPARFSDFIPDTLACCYVRRDINLKAVFCGIARARDHGIREAADCAVLEPVI